MDEYPKIKSIFKRNLETGKFIEGRYSIPEFEYLKDVTWVFTEKVNGTNVRIIWETDALVDKITIKGRTENSQMPTFLYNKLQEMFTVEKFKKLFPDISVTLYGEGYGAKIQKGGGNYIKDGASFVLFDVKIGRWWLKREDIEKIANDLDIEVVPIIGEGTLKHALYLARGGIKSQWGNFLAEGLVLKPKIELVDRAGRRIVTKVKSTDFER